MRCKKCPYLHTVEYEDDYETCEVFGDNDDYVSVDRNDNFGCKYNLKTLKKIYERESKIRDKAICEYMQGFVDFMKEQESNKG